MNLAPASVYAPGNAWLHPHTVNPNRHLAGCDEIRSLRHELLHRAGTRDAEAMPISLSNRRVLEALQGIVKSGEYHAY